MNTHQHDYLEPGKHWRDCHLCAKTLLKQLANGWLIWQKVQLDATRARMDKISREVVGDDNVPREWVDDTDD